MSNFGNVDEELRCSFCGKSEYNVKRLITGGHVHICDECVDICYEIIHDKLSDDLPKADESKTVE